MGDRRRREAGDPRSLSVRDGGPPGEERALLRARRAARSSVPETELGRVPDLARSLLGDPDRLKEMGEAMKRVARPDAAEEIAEELIALAR